MSEFNDKCHYCAGAHYMLNLVNTEDRAYQKIPCRCAIPYMEELEARISILEKERASLEGRVGELERALIDIRDYIAFIPLLNEASKGTLFDEGYVTGYHHAVNWRLERFDAIAYALASKPREGTEEPK